MSCMLESAIVQTLDLAFIKVVFEARFDPLTLC